MQLTWQPYNLLISRGDIHTPLLPDRRKYSKETSYAVVDTLRRANVYDSTAAAALVATRDQTRETEWVSVAERRLAEADVRLAKVREMYERELGSGVSLSGGMLAVSNSGPQGTGSLDIGATVGKEQQATVVAVAAASGPNAGA